MHNYFYFGLDAGPLYFQAWDIDGTVWKFAVAWIALFLTGVFYEWMATLRRTLDQRQEEKDLLMKRLAFSDPSIPLLDKMKHGSSHNLVYLRRTVLHVFQLSISYMLMLTIMSYNLGLVFAVLAGAATGYFFFARERATAEDVLACHSV